MAAVLKIARSGDRSRGFESHALRSWVPPVRWAAPPSPSPLADNSRGDDPLDPPMRAAPAKRCTLLPPLAGPPTGNASGAGCAREAGATSLGHRARYAPFVR